MRVGTYNLLIQRCLPMMKEYDAREEPWESRLPRLVDRICSCAPDIMCLQEVQGREHFDALAHNSCGKGLLRRLYAS